MGRKGFKRGGKKQFGKRPQVDDRNNGWTEIARENEKWEKYYKALNIIPEAEWDAFNKACQDTLPLTFRITGSRAHAQEIQEIFVNKHLPLIQDTEWEGEKLAPPKELSWYPDHLGWQLDVSKSVLRKNEQFAQTQRFLVVETEVGNISRQEAVSMIPPLVLDVEPHHAVLDMCAAPGSKTAQLVEALHAQDSVTPATGFVLANDSDYKRSHMLIHQVKRLNSPNFCVVNHDAQLFPKIRLDGQKEFVKFDRILCDVPCSGDGTMRKNVTVWKDWNTGNALGLHTLQLNILNRGLQLLKRGGRLVYSTCSMSPVENEAVVAAALRKWGNQIRLVNCDDRLPGLVRSEGISDWPVFGKDMELREIGAEDVAASVFPPSEEEAKAFNLKNCIRVYPHQQNTGGFFITVFEKIGETVEKKRAASDEQEAVKKAKIDADTPAGTPVPADAPVAAPKQIVKMRKEKLPRDANEEPFVFLDPNHPQLLKCWEFYHIEKDFAKDCTLVRNAQGEPIRTIYYVAPAIRDILSANEQKLKFIHAGIKLFVSQRGEGECLWRAQSESLNVLEHALGPERRISCNPDMLLKLCQQSFPHLPSLAEAEADVAFVEEAKKFEIGCVFLTVNRGEGKEQLFLPLWKGKNSINLMVSKAETYELLYRVFGIVTEKNAEYKQQAKPQKQVEGETPVESAVESAVESTIESAVESVAETPFESAVETPTEVAEAEIPAETAQ
ncbi:hypothetical protein BABINDRAFT_31874 [Babjeviella inositovora NRRL Y-12698]|uniref:SAM-dependent MTase RsmB/NOP-type domain-containing protein n=1 Tax=Babjeviella inositovora NRRL Y-12698 TaxID=984486 RepID=A0A1E3QY35_9ASCO|nr:uncharacterized protein BABINDRAFT_31874 [Babjeviella inositovora NRRL Y-12698]ODQ82012.1 hypothetical protein BABINDRAFT_31874 [Babjeviella inositovora NRRL Y-12698]